MAQVIAWLRRKLAKPEHPAIIEAEADAALFGSGWVRIDGNGRMQRVAPGHVEIRIPIVPRGTKAESVRRALN